TAPPRALPWARLSQPFGLKTTPGPSDQVLDHLAAIDDGYRPALRGVIHLCGVDAQLAEDGAQEVRYAHRLGSGVGSGLVGRADDLSRLRAAAGEDHALRHRPMVAAGVVVHARR